MRLHGRGGLVVDGGRAMGCHEDVMCGLSEGCINTGVPMVIRGVLGCAMGCWT